MSNGHPETNLFILFDAAESVASYAMDIEVPGYSFSKEQLKSHIHMPGVSPAPVRCLFYAQNYFRIFVSDQVVEFVREAELPSELAFGERNLVKGLLNTGQFTIVRWISTSQGWDDNDRPYTVTIAEGNKESSVPFLR
jgi:hypothetical protein